MLRRSILFPKADKYARLEHTIYLVCWTIVFCIPIVSQIAVIHSGTDNSMQWEEVGKAYQAIIPVFLLFVINNFILLPQLFWKDRKIWYFVALVGLLALLWCIQMPPHPQHMEPEMMKPNGLPGMFDPGMPMPEMHPMHEMPKPHHHGMLDMFLITKLIIELCVIFANFGIKFYIQSMRQEVLTLNMQNEKILQELQSLKYQISPHFLMNTLNNIQSLIESSPASACKTVQQLSKIAGAEVNIAAGTDGLDCESDIVMKGGVVRASVTSDGSKGTKADRNISLYGGRLAVLTSGGVDTSNSSDVKGCAAIKCDGTLNIDGATLALKSTGQGGKGISVDGEMTMNSGMVQITTTGSRYGSSSNNLGGEPGGMQPGGMPGGNPPTGGPGFGTRATFPGNPTGSTNALESVSPKGVRCDNNITINGGTIQVVTSGENDGAEGMESKKSLAINGGMVEISAYDDAINAATSITISGGNTYAYSASNDAIDSNGTMTLKGGLVIASGSTVPEEALDTDNGRNLSICGGTILGTGGTQVEPQGTNSQAFCVFSYNLTKGTLLTLLGKDGKHIISYTLPRNASVGIVSANAMGNGYSLYIGGAVSEGQAFHGAVLNGTFLPDGVQKIKEK